MGKVRVKTFDESAIAEEDAKKKAKREAKKTAKQAEKEAKKAEAPLVEEKAESKEATTTNETNEAPDQKTSEPVMASNPPANEETVPSEPKKTKKEKFVTVKDEGKRTRGNKQIVSRSQKYPLDKAVTLLTQFKTSKFDETVELHVNVKEKGISGSLRLPHGSGKTLRIKIADDATLTAIEAGKIDFDVLVADPAMMPKLAKVARVLGPRGLMPNPKNGTIAQNPEDAVKKLSGGEMRFKTEAKAPVIHLIIGKLSFGSDKILENTKAALTAIGDTKIKSATLTSTMSPGIKLQLTN